jgi:L-rhamnose-H+ transport protein
MQAITGLFLIVLAGCLQGLFILPLTFTRRWQWEHSWAVFSLFGMLLFNWLIALVLLPHAFAAYRSVPTAELLTVVAFGAGWGLGAILFGLGMAKLGMALGYPVIMGLIASLGALVPLLLRNPAELATLKGAVLLIGMVIVVAGIILCSRASALKGTTIGALASAAAGAGGLLIAVAAGVLSCLPNVGMNYAQGLVRAAETAGTTHAMAGNVVWALLFTAGFVMNGAYCVGLMVRRGNLRDLWRNEPGRNVAWCALTALLWIGSFYLYGWGAARLGSWGGIVGWPFFICLAIAVGNLAGLWRGEWSGAPRTARVKLNLGLALLVLAVAVIALSSIVKTP